MTPGGWSTDRDRAQAMGLVLAIIDGMRESVVKPDTDPDTVRTGLADLVENVAKAEFGEHWGRFKDHVRAALGEMS